MAYFLGVDAGGTKTEFVVGDETRELARVRTGTLQRLRTDAQTAKANLEEGLRGLTAASCVSMQSIERCCIGSSGETVPLVVATSESEVRKAPGQRSDACWSPEQ